MDTRLPADLAYAYWQSPMSRKEAQKVFDEFALVMAELKTTIHKLDFATGYLLEAANVTPEQVQEFMKRKLTEYVEKQPAQPAVPGLVTGETS